jgi:hypothetical protein
MPIGIVSDDDFALELERLKNPKPPSEFEPIQNEPNREKEESSSPEIKTIEPRGRGSSNVEVPDTLRSIIALTAIESGRAEALALAREFDISPSSVSAYTNGATSTASYNSPDPPLKKKINNTKERLGKIARGKLALSLRHITEDKLAEAKLRDVAAVAANMAAVVRQMEPDSDKSVSQVNIVLYAPKLKSESSYDIIEGEIEQ